MTEASAVVSRLSDLTTGHATQLKDHIFSDGRNFMSYNGQWTLTIDSALHESFFFIQIYKNLHSSFVESKVVELQSFLSHQFFNCSSSKIQIA